MIESWKRRNKLYAEGYKLCAEGDKLYAEGRKLYAEGRKLRAEGYKLRAEGDIQWYDAIIAKFGNVEVVFDAQGNCTVQGQTFTYH